MAAEFPSPTPSVRGGRVTTERIYVDDDGKRVPADSTAPKRLYAHAGATLSESEARRLGVTDSGVPSDDGPVSTSEDTEPEPEPVEAGEEQEPEAEDDDESHVCDVCGFEAKSAAGLGAHQRTHEDDE